MLLNSTVARVVALALAVALVALIPLAHASPPDPSWIAGLYDGSDHDDAVLAAADTPGSPGLGCSLGRPAHGPEGDITDLRPPTVVRSALSVPADRGPPAR